MKDLTIYDNIEPAKYHVTTNISTPEAIKKEKKAAKQEDTVYSIYKQYSILSPSQAYKIYCENHSPAPITSIRRAISNLKKAGYLTRTEVMVTGLYGDPEHCYKIN